MKKKALALAILLALGLSPLGIVTGCSGSTQVQPPPPPVDTSITQPTCTPTSVQMGLTFTCSGSVVKRNDDSTDTSAVVTYMVDNVKIATITTAGKGTAVAVGTVNVTAIFGTLPPSAPIKIAVTAPPPPTLKSLSAPVCGTSATVVAGLSVQCGPETGTMSDNSTVANYPGVTFNGSNPAVATVSPTGLVTTLTAGTVTVTASVTTNGVTVTSPATTITVTDGIALTSFTPNRFSYNGPGNITMPATLNGAGLPPGGSCNASGFPNPLPLPKNVSPRSYPFFFTNDFRPRFMNVFCSNAAGTMKSNTIPIVNVGDQRSGGGGMDIVYGRDAQTGSLYAFNATNGAPLPTTLTSARTNPGDMVVDTDPTTGKVDYVVVNAKNQQIDWYRPDGSAAGIMSDVGIPTLLGLAVDRHKACTLEPTRGWCINLTSPQGTAPTHFFAAGTYPLTLGMSHGSGSTNVYPLDVAGDTKTSNPAPTLYGYAVADDGTTTAPKSLVFPEFTSATKWAGDINSVFAFSYLAQWQVAPLNSSSMVGVLGSVLNSDNSVSYKLALVDGNSMTKLTSTIALPDECTTIFADNKNDGILVFCADLSGVQGEVRIYRYDRTGTQHLLPATAPTSATPLTVWPAGIALSADGSTIYILGWDPLGPIGDFVLKSVPNN